MSETDILLRLLMATACGGIIGLERERGDRPAGFRTYIMVAVGAALFTILSLTAFPGSDPARIAAQIVVGMGFLGAGVIVVYGGTTHVVGITTAATMWATAAVGMASGSGYFVTSLVCTGLILMVLIVLPLVETRIIHRFQRRRLYFTVSGRHRAGLLEEIQRMLDKYGIKGVLLRYQKCGEENEECSLIMRVNVPSRVNLVDVLEELYKIQGVTLVSFED